MFQRPAHARMCPAALRHCDCGPMFCSTAGSLILVAPLVVHMDQDLAQNGETEMLHQTVLPLHRQAAQHMAMAVKSCKQMRTVGRQRCLGWRSSIGFKAVLLLMQLPLFTLLPVWLHQKHGPACASLTGAATSPADAGCWSRSVSAAPACQLSLRAVGLPHGKLQQPTN